MSQPSPVGADHDIAPGQRLVRTQRRQPRLRAGLVQLAYVAGAVDAAILAAEIRAGPQVNAARTSNMLFAVGGGIISLVAVVFSLLFLTVQFASTALSKKKRAFRSVQIGPTVHEITHRGRVIDQLYGATHRPARRLRA